MKFFSVVSAIFLAAFTATAQTNIEAVAGRAMSLADCIQEALAHNLDLQIERYNPQISLYKLSGQYADYDPTFNLSGQHEHHTGVTQTNSARIVTLTDTNFVVFPRATTDKNVFGADVKGALPWGLQYDLVASAEQNTGTSFSGTNSIISSFNRSTDATVEADLTQHLLRDFWIDTTRLNIRVAKNRVLYSQQGLRAQLIATVAAVATAYYELIYARENVTVRQQALNLAQTQFQQDQQRVQVGSLAPLDVQQDQSQVAKSQADLIAAQAVFNKDQNTLKNLITDAYAAWHDTNIEPTATLAAPMELFDLQDSWSKGMTLRPELLQARLDVEKQGIQLKYDRNQLFPQLDLIGSYGYAGDARGYSGTFNEVGSGNRPFYTFGAKLSMPLSNLGARSTLKSDKVSKTQLLLTLKQLEQTIMVAIDNTVKQAQSDYQSAEATRLARVYAEAALNAEQKKYAVGKSTTFTVLQLQNNLTTARSDEIRALANYNQSLVTLAQQEGTTLERNEINLDVQRK